MPCYIVPYTFHTISYLNAFAHSVPSAWNVLPFVAFLAIYTSPLMTLPAHDSPPCSLL